MEALQTDSGGSLQMHYRSNGPCSSSVRSAATGTDVTNDRNEKIGNIDDIIVGQDRAVYAVLQVGGFLGVGGRLVAVPFQSLVLDDSGRKIQLPGATREALKKLPVFEHAS